VNPRRLPRISRADATSAIVSRPTGELIVETYWRRKPRNGAGVMPAPGSSAVRHYPLAGSGPHGRAARTLWRGWGVSNTQVRSGRPFTP